jgi:hypothetical protein
MRLTIDSHTHSFEFAEVRSAVFDDETVLYNPATRKLLTLNPASSYIWTLITKSHNEELDLSDLQIGKALLQYFQTDDKFSDVLGEVRACIELLISESIILIADEKTSL